MTIIELISLANRAGTIEERANIYRHHTHHANLRVWECPYLEFAPAWSSFISLPTSLSTRVYALAEDLTIYRAIESPSNKQIKEVIAGLSVYEVGDLSCFIHRFILMDAFNLERLSRSFVYLPKIVSQRTSYLRLKLAIKDRKAPPTKMIRQVKVSKIKGTHPLFAAIKEHNE